MTLLRQMMERKPIGPEPDAGLRRTLGAASLVALGIGAIVGAGLFSLTGIARAQRAAAIRAA